jgi:hypothetical protein
LVFDWGPFDENLEILGYPHADLAVGADKPVAFVSAKLCDVFEDGTSALVSRGFLNLTHRRSHSAPEALEPGRLYDVGVDLSATSWVLERGHRLRLALAGTDWPNVWTPPEPVTLTFAPDSSRLVVPVVRGHNGLESPMLRPPPAERGETKDAPKALASEGKVKWRIEHDILGRQTHYEVDHGSTYGTEIGSKMTESYFGRLSVSPDDPGPAHAEGRVRYEIEWPEATVTTEVRSHLRSSPETYVFELDLDVTHNGALLGRRRWERRFDRRLQ